MDSRSSASRASRSRQDPSPVLGPDCPRCPRLVEFREENRQKHPDWHNAPVPSFGSLSSAVLVVGLAPGLRGANATGRPFTGDFAGDLLYSTLLDAGLAEGTYQARSDDGLKLRGLRITNAVRCVPPQNRPSGEEARNCRPFLLAEIKAMDQLKCIVTLGSIAHKATLRCLDMRDRDAPFGHGRLIEPEGKPAVLSSYHCSRLNTNTGRLTRDMFREIFQRAIKLAEG